MDAIMQQKSRKKQKSNTIYLKSLFVAVLLVALIALELTRNGSYLDEAVGIASIPVILYYYKRIPSYELVTLAIMVVIVLIGVFSNLIFSINSSLSSVFIDIVSQTKLFLGFFGIRYALNDTEKKAVTNYLLLPAKIFLLSAFVCAVVSIFVSIGMSGEVRYGLRTFNFIFDFNHQYTSVAFLCFGTIVRSEKMPQRVKSFYYVIGIVAIALALKSPALMFSLIFVFFLFYFKRYERLSLKIIIPLLVALVLASRYQLQTYIMDKEATRRVFIDYAFVDANEHFPLGSGFGTYGSAEAAKNYSPLYYEYGFHRRWGMSPNNSSFLFDTYWPCLLGQYGWFGFILNLILYYRWFVIIKNSQGEYDTQALLYALFFQYLIHALGAAILTSSAGLIGVLGLSLFCIPDREKIKNIKHQRIRLRI